MQITKQMRVLTIILGLSIFLIKPIDAVAQDLQHIFRIEAANCISDPQSRVQTGFRAQGLPGIVTTLHGVIGCNDINARSYENKLIVNDLQITQVDVEHDVALLTSLQLSDTNGLDVTDEIPDRGSKARVVGHPQALPELHGMSLEFDSVESTKRLSELVPIDIRADLKSFGSPSLYIDVLSLTGDLQPGHSGAPVFDNQGFVVGVADGGLGEGKVGIGWAIPWNQIAFEPISANQGMLNDLGGSDLLFWYGSETEPDSFSCTPEKLPVYKATGSSAGKSNYSAMKVLDGKTSISFLFNSWFTAPGDTIGAWIKLDLDQVATITGLRYFFHPPSLPIVQSQIRKATLQTPNGYSESVAFPMMSESGWQNKKIKPVKTDELTLTVDDIFPSPQGQKQIQVIEMELLGCLSD